MSELCKKIFIILLIAIVIFITLKIKITGGLLSHAEKRLVIDRDPDSEEMDDYIPNSAITPLISTLSTEILDIEPNTDEMERLKYVKKEILGNKITENVLVMNENFAKNTIEYMNFKLGETIDEKNHFIYDLEFILDQSNKDIVSLQCYSANFYRILNRMFMDLDYENIFYSNKPFSSHDFNINMTTSSSIVSRLIDLKLGSQTKEPCYNNNQLRIYEANGEDFTDLCPKKKNGIDARKVKQSVMANIAYHPSLVNVQNFREKLQSKLYNIIEFMKGGGYTNLTPLEITNNTLNLLKEYRIYKKENLTKYGKEPSVFFRCDQWWPGKGGVPKLGIYEKDFFLSTSIGAPSTDFIGTYLTILIPGKNTFGFPAYLISVYPQECEQVFLPSKIKVIKIYKVDGKIEEWNNLPIPQVIDSTVTNLFKEELNNFKSTKLKNLKWIIIGIITENTDEELNKQSKIDYSDKQIINRVKQQIYENEQSLEGVNTKVLGFYNNKKDIDSPIPTDLNILPLRPLTSLK